MKPYNERLPMIDEAIDKLIRITKDTVESYKQKESTMSDDWYEKGELPPVGEVVRHKESGKDVEVKCHLRTGQIIGERLGCPIIEIGFASDFEPLRTETDKLVAQMKRDLSGEWGVSLQRANAICTNLIKKDYRKIKPMSRDECISKIFGLTNNIGMADAAILYDAGCRFIDKGE